MHKLPHDRKLQSVFICLTQFFEKTEIHYKFQVLPVIILSLYWTNHNLLMHYLFNRYLVKNSYQILNVP